MKHSEAHSLLEELRQDIKASRLDPHMQNYMEGLIECLEQYLSRIYVMLPSVVDENQ